MRRGAGRECCCRFGAESLDRVRLGRRVPGGWHRGVAGEAGAGPAPAVVRGAAADAVHADRRCGPAAVRIPVRAVDPRPGPATDLHQVRCPVVGSVGGAAAADTGTVPPAASVSGQPARRRPGRALAGAGLPGDPRRRRPGRSDYLYFADEAGIRSEDHAGTTWAPVGQTPV